MGGELPYWQQEQERAEQEYRMRAIEKLIIHDETDLPAAFDIAEKVVHFVMTGERPRPDVRREELLIDPMPCSNVRHLPDNAKQARPEVREEF